MKKRSRSRKLLQGPLGGGTVGGAPQFLVRGPFQLWVKLTRSTHGGGKVKVGDLLGKEKKGAKMIYLGVHYLTLMRNENDYFK